jgi:hypothetical protein
VKFPCDKLENQLNLQDGEIDHRQHAGIHSVSSQRNVQKDSTTLESSDVDKFVITDGKRTTTAIHNQKHPSFSISSATCCHHMMIHQTPPPPVNADTLPRLDATRILSTSFSFT